MLPWSHTKRHDRTRLLYSRARRAAQDLAVAQRRHLIHGLLEADITRARSLLRRYEEETGIALSFTAYIITCVARAVDEQKSIQAYRQGRRHVVIFDDVDVTTLIEREVHGQTQVMFHIVRAANTKTLLAIHREIRDAQAQRSTGLSQVGVRLFNVLPGIIRRFGVWIAARNPTLWKRFGGTVAVTAVGMFAKGGGWGIAVTANTLAVTVGGIDEKPRLIDGRLVERAFLGLTVSVDHDIVDGAPTTRFAARLRELIESGYGLSQLVADIPGAAVGQSPVSMVQPL
jgi:pyruvate/2-oxoglutarate dehydrogenase complex dihydrolipoamide acyltransferase (E2) component